MHPKDLSIGDFTYDLPTEKIALFPVHPRDISKLLIYNKGKIQQDIYRNISNYLPANSALIFNDTRVIKSRILFPKPTGAVIEIFCLEPFEKFIDYDSLFQQTETSLWKCLIGKAGKWKEKQLSKHIIINNQDVLLTAELIEKLPDCYVVKFSWTPGDLRFGEIIDIAGVTPLPPYIKRKSNKEDETDYQTVYSEHEGSVAAPTAGLHFTDEMLEDFQKRGIPTLFTTLHVGAGTFKPVKSETMGGHIMHSEWMNITTGFLKNLYQNLDKRIICVGTTATRTLESIYWMGNKILNNKNITAEDLKITQWEVYSPQKTFSRKEAVSALIGWIESEHHSHLLIETGIIIAPGYIYKIMDGLIINFHQPKSTLLLLVSAFMGEDWKRVYDYALNNNFRFLSYGDGCLILK